MAALSVVGTVVAAITSPSPIHPAETAKGSASPGIADLLRGIFPDSPFSALPSGQVLLPTFFLALLLGLSFSHDRQATRPVVQLFDSLSRVFYQINSFFVEFLGILIIAVTASNYWP